MLPAARSELGLSSRVINDRTSASRAGLAARMITLLLRGSATIEVR